MWGENAEEAGKSYLGEAPRYLVTDLLTFAFESIRSHTFGYIKAKDAFKNHIGNKYLRASYDAALRGMFDSQVCNRPVIAESHEQAIVINDWVLSQMEQVSDYTRNLASCYNQCALPYADLMKHANLIVSAIGAFEAAMSPKVAPALTNSATVMNAARPSYKVGERIEAEVTCGRTRSGEGDYGPWYMYVFNAGDGADFVWFASRRQEITRGKKYRIRATVKKLDSYNGRQQTHISRAAVIAG